MNDAVNLASNTPEISPEIATEILPIAKINGNLICEIPTDLYIPPDALEVFLETFEGPLDLLLYLIRKQDIDILDIPIAQVTRQYLQYIEMMHSLQLELAAEYLVMAAFLAEIKSRVLLPISPTATEEEQDPRAELVRRLQEYEQIKKAAETLDTLPRVDRDIFLVPPLPLEKPKVSVLPKASLQDLLFAFYEVLKRANLRATHEIRREPISIRARMTQILEKITKDSVVDFPHLFDIEEGRMGVVVTFMALLELVKSALIELIQALPLGTIQIKTVGGV